MIAVELWFDAESTAQLKSTWAALEKVYGSPQVTELGARPHISLALFPDGEPHFLKTSIEHLSEAFAPWEVRWDGVEFFPTAEGVVYLAPIPSEQLLAVHSAFHDLIADPSVRKNPYYDPGAWIPHCTVATGVPEDVISAVVRQARHSMVGDRVMIEEVAAVAYRPARELYRFPFRAK